MNFLPVHAILDEVRTLASQSLPKEECELQKPSFLRPKVRIVLSQDAFIGLFLRSLDQEVRLLADRSWQTCLWNRQPRRAALSPGRQSYRSCHYQGGHLG